MQAKPARLEFISSPEKKKRTGDAKPPVRDLQ
jgi:hypothetical protein